MKDTYYFSHDYNARSDIKIKSLIRKHGILGYGVYWCIIEDLYNNANALRLDCDSIAYELRTDEELVKSIINDFELFVIQDGYFMSLSVERRLIERENRSTKARKSANERWEKHRNNANAMQTHSDSNAIKEIKEKEIKEKKESKEIILNNEFEILDEFSFDLFWELYDKKTGKETCIKLYSKLNQKEKEKIFNHVPLYKQSKPDKQFRKDPQTYLRNKSWNDEIILPEEKSKLSNFITLYKDIQNERTDRFDTGKKFGEI